MRVGPPVVDTRTLLSSLLSSWYSGSVSPTAAPHQSSAANRKKILLSVCWLLAVIVVAAASVFRPPDYFLLMKGGLPIPVGDERTTNTVTTTATTAGQQRRKKKRKRTRMVVHIGPPKTGSTTLQFDFKKLFWKYGNDPLLLNMSSEHTFNNHNPFNNLNHSVIYLGKGNNPPRSNNDIYNSLFNDRDCLRELRRYYQQNSDNNKETTEEKKFDYGQVPCWNDFLHKLGRVKRKCDESAAMECTVLLSDEDMGGNCLLGLPTTQRTRFENVPLYPHHLDAFSRALKKYDFDVSVVALYRRYGEQLMSAYKMKQKIRYGNENVRWPKEGGPAECSDPWETIASWVRDPEAASLTRSLEEVVPYWSEYFGRRSIQIMDFHKTSHLTADFLCSYVFVPKGSNAKERERCKRTILSNLDADVEQRKLQDKQQIESGHHHDTHQRAASVDECLYDSIAVAAYNKGTIHFPEENSTRLKVRMSIQSKVSLTLKNLPPQYISCPPESELNLLLNRSIAIERKYMPGLYRNDGGSDQQERLHKDALWDLAYGRRELCRIRADAMIPPNVTTLGELIRSLNRLVPE